MNWVGLILEQICPIKNRVLVCLVETLHYQLCVFFKNN